MWERLLHNLRPSELETLRETLAIILKDRAKEMLADFDVDDPDTWDSATAVSVLHAAWDSADTVLSGNKIYPRS